MQTAMIRAGIRIQQDSLDADAVIIWSVLWAGRMAGNREIYQHYRDLQRPVIVVDVGTLQRGVTWKIALDNVNALGWFGDVGRVDQDRPTKLGLSRQVSPGGSDILIATQHRQSLQAQDIPSMHAWVLHKIQQIKLVTDRPIVVRPHPRDRMAFQTLPAGVKLEVPKLVPGSYDSFDWRNTWHAVVNHNSGPGVLAGIAGIRPVVHESSLASPVSVNISDLEQAYEIDRSSWLIDLAHTEYLLDEIEQGLWLKRLGSRL